MGSLVHDQRESGSRIQATQSTFQHPSSYGMAAPDQLSLNGYYPAGYPVLYEPDTRVVNYKNVVKELEDAKR